MPRGGSLAQTQRCRPLTALQVIHLNLAKIQWSCYPYSERAFGNGVTSKRNCDAQLPLDTNTQTKNIPLLMVAD